MLGNSRKLIVILLALSLISTVMALTLADGLSPEITISLETDKGNTFQVGDEVVLDVVASSESNLPIWTIDLSFSEDNANFEFIVDPALNNNTFYNNENLGVANLGEVFIVYDLFTQTFRLNDYWLVPSNPPEIGPDGVTIGKIKIMGTDTAAGNIISLAGGSKFQTGSANFGQQIYDQIV